MRLRLALLACLAFGLGSCAFFKGPAPAPITEEERRAYARGVAMLPDQPEAARRQFEEFVNLFPNSGLADDAAIRLAQLALDDDDRIRWYGFVLDHHPQSPLADGARVRLASVRYGQGEAQEAAELLASVRYSKLPRDKRKVAYTLLAETAEDPVERLRWLAALRADETEEDRVAVIDVEIDNLLRTLDADQHARAAEQIGRRVPAARVLLSAAEQALDAGDLEGARRAVDRAERLPLAPQYAARLGAVSERLRLREAGPQQVADLPTFEEVLRDPSPSTAEAVGTIGVLLPLSGDFADVGEESLRGVMLAAELFGGPSAASDPAATAGSGWGFGRRAPTPPSQPKVRLLIRDTGGRPERAAQAVRQLARNEDVSAIIGPLLKAECEAAAAEAESAGIPLLALTSREEIAAGRPNVFRTRTTPQEEVSVLVSHAIEQFGAQRFAILYPADAYGRGLRALFWDEVEKRGGRVVGVASYEPDATDFAEPIRQLVGYTLLTEGEEEALEEREDMRRRARRLPTEEALALREEAKALLGPDDQPLPPIVDFDALFIPEAHDKVVLIAPQLAYHEATGMRLLGPSGWYHSDLVSIGRGHVRNALFASQFFADSPLPFVRSFADRYTSVFGGAPDVFAAQAFDATNLVLVQMAKGLVTRPAVRDGVLDVRGYPGVTGVLSIRSDGNAQHRPFLLAVERGRFVQVNGPLN